MRYNDPNDLYSGPGTAGTTGSSGGPPAVAPPPAPPGTVQTAPGYNPDYGSLITNDPAYQSAKAAADLAQRQAAAQRKQSLRQAIVQYGGLPSGFADQYGDVDQSVLDEAGQNQFSTLAQLARNYSQNEEQFKRGLAARGALQSGDLNYGEDQLQTGYGQQRYDAANALSSQINQALQGYSGVLGQNAQALAGAVQGAEANVYSNPAYRPTEAQSANYDAKNSAAYGQPIYVDSSGSLYDLNGNPFTPPAPSAPSSDGDYVGNAHTPGLQY